MIDKGTCFIQTLPTFSARDAVGNHVCAIHNLLSEHGYDSKIAAAGGNLQGVLPVSLLKKTLNKGKHILIHHMSIGAEINEMVAGFPCRKVMIYHNITPPQYFRVYGDEVADLCALGRRQLSRMSGQFDAAMAVSEYNAKELRELGYKNVQVVPLIVDFSRYDAVVWDARTLCDFEDGKTNILFVGRGSPNKCQLDIIAAYACFRRHCPDSRLLLAGSWFTPYLHSAERMIAALHLEEHVFILHNVSESALKTLYRISHLFLCMSEHEGFCVPLLEAMHFEVPILAFASSAIPETLGGSGVLFYEKNYEAIAGMMVLLIQDGELRHHVINSQKKRLSALSEKKIKERLIEALNKALQLPLIKLNVNDFKA